MSEKRKCQRCGTPCEPGTPDPRAELLRLSDSTGLCRECAVTQVFKDRQHGVSLEQVLQGSNLDGEPRRRIQDSMLDPANQRNFAEILTAAHAQVDLAEIDWPRVVANWDLPFNPKSIAPRR